MNYRKFYEEVTKVKLPEDFDVHHIDGNRKNNQITNLVALPSELHKKYHDLVFYFKNKNFRPIVRILGVLNGGNGFNDYYKICYDNFLKIYKQCQKYVDYRDYLLNKIYDFHIIGKNYGR